MRKLLILAVALTACAACGRHPDIQTKEFAQKTETPAQIVPGNAASETEKKSVPDAFKNVDFRNFTYPVSKTRVRLKDGTYERREPRGGGGDTFHLNDVDYADLTGDGAEEAIVQLDRISCGVSCDGGTDFFYFYSAKRGQLSLLTRLEIGSFAYDCGLKSFRLKKGNLALETFRSCRFTGSAFRPVQNDPEEQGGKLSTNRYTTFDLYFKGNRFVQRKRQVIYYPDVYDFRSDGRRVKISNE